MPNISLLCIRGTGDKSDENIVDPLFSDTNVMRERARMLFNQKESNRIQSSNVCSLKAFVLPTSLIRLNNFDNEIHTGLLKSTNIDINISDNDITMTTELNVERLST